jgi:hypothetical protein
MFSFFHDNLRNTLTKYTVLWTVARLKGDGKPSVFEETKTLECMDWDVMKTR